MQAGGEPNHEPETTVAKTQPSALESTKERLVRRARQARLYLSTVAAVALLVVLILLISANVRTVKIDWVIGSTRASLVWIVLVATLLGWLLGIATSLAFRHRARTRQR